MNSDELAKFVGNRIKENRIKNKLTQKQLGQKIGVKDNTVSAYERGAISPEQDMLFALSDAMDLRLDDFFPSKEHEKLDRAVKMSDDLSVQDMEFFNQLIEKTLSLSGEDREKFLESIRFTVEYYNRINS